MGPRKLTGGDDEAIGRREGLLEASVAGPLLGRHSDPHRIDPGRIHDPYGAADSIDAARDDCRVINREGKLRRSGAVSFAEARGGEEC
jgi:hypothetical protein